MAMVKPGRYSRGDGGQRTATIFLLVENAIPATARPSRTLMMLTTPPVWRSQLIMNEFEASTHPEEGSSSARPNQVNIFISRGKMSRIGVPRIPRGDSRVWSRWRVAESSISTLIMSCAPIAMKLLHGDHTTGPILKGNDVAAMSGSHVIGTPHTTRVKGWAYDSYSFRIVDVFGDSTSAE